MRQVKLRVAIMGTAPMPGVLDAAAAAGKRVAEDGGVAEIMQMSNICSEPFRGMGVMRNMAIMRALDRGSSHIVLMDGDVKVEPVTFSRLISRHRDIVIPYFHQVWPGGGRERLMVPQFAKDGTDLKQLRWVGPDGTPALADGEHESEVFMDGPLVALRWCVVSCVLFDARVFQRISPQPFIPCTTCYCEDEYNGLTWRSAGAEIWQDLTTGVDLLKPPGLLSDLIAERRILKPGEMP